MNQAGNTSDTRERILDVAEALVQRCGPNGMSYQDISREVGIRKASIHHHFPTKEDLLVELVERYGRNSLALLDGLVASPLGAVAKLEELFVLEEAEVRDGRKACLFAMVTAESQRSDSRPMERVRHYVKEIEERFAAILKQGRDEGSLHFGGDPREVAASLFSFIQGVMFNARINTEPEWFRGMCRQMLRLLGAG